MSKYGIMAIVFLLRKESNWKSKFEYRKWKKWVRTEIMGLVKATLIG